MDPHTGGLQLEHLKMSPHTDVPTLTPLQRELARHALGLPNDTARSYRNRYNCDRLHPRFNSWERMVRKGLAARDLFETNGRRSFIFRMTPKGAALALDPGERGGG